MHNSTTMDGSAAELQAAKQAIEHQSKLAETSKEESDALRLKVGMLKAFQCNNR